MTSQTIASFNCEHMAVCILLGVYYSVEEESWYCGVFQIVNGSLIHWFKRPKVKGQCGSQDVIIQPQRPLESMPLFFRYLVFVVGGVMRCCV